MGIDNGQPGAGVTEFRVQSVLRGGLILAYALMLAGVLVKLGSGDWTAPAVMIPSIFDGSLILGDRILAFGVLILALTPIFRVAALLILWIQERDWVYVAVCLAVAFVLGASVMVGGG